MYTANRFHDGDHYVSVLAREGRTRLHITYRDDCGVAHRALPREDAKFLSPLYRNGKPYPVDRMVRHLKALGRSAGITQAAKDELAGWSAE